MADVIEALLTDRPVGVVVVVPAEGEPHRPRHRDAVSRAGHLHGVGLLDGQVAPVRGVVAGPAGADRPVIAEPAVVVDLSTVHRGVADGDQRRADVERLGQGVVTVHARRALHAVQVPGKAHPGAARPVVTRPEVGAGDGHVAGVVPVPGADHRLGRGDLQGSLDRRPVGDLLAEVQDDRHPHAIGLVVPLEDLGPERLARCQRAERARSGDVGRHGRTRWRSRCRTVRGPAPTGCARPCRPG